MSNEIPPIHAVERPRAAGGSVPWLIIAGVAAIVLLVLFHFPPETNAFYPRCGLYTLTGLQCPGCGGLRAAHHLLHGDLATAFHYNPLFVLLLPYGALWLVAPIFKARTGKPWLDFTRTSTAGWTLLLIALIFGIGRNLFR